MLYPVCGKPCDTFVFCIVISLVVQIVKCFLHLVGFMYGYEWTILFKQLWFIALCYWRYCFELQWGDRSLWSTGMTSFMTGVCVCVCVYIYGALVINSPGITNRRQLFSAPSQLPYLPCSDVINTSLISPWPMWLLMDRKFREFFIGLSLRRINPLNPELNPICYLLALLGAHHFLHVSRIRVKLLTLRRLMSYIYIWSTHSWCF